MTVAVMIPVAPSEYEGSSTVAKARDGLCRRNPLGAGALLVPMPTLPPAAAPPRLVVSSSVRAPLLVQSFRYDGRLQLAHNPTTVGTRKEIFTR